jgi:hypothetical protein
MQNEYARKIIHEIQETKYDEIMVLRYQLNDDDIDLIKKVVVEFNKNIIFTSTHDILFNNNDDVLVVIP